MAGSNTKGSLHGHDSMIEYDNVTNKDTQTQYLDDQKATAADEAEHSLTTRQAFQYYWKAVAWSALVSMALVMESYGMSDSLLSEMHVRNSHHDSSTGPRSV